MFKSPSLFPYFPMIALLNFWDLFVMKCLLKLLPERWKRWTITTLESLESKHLVQDMIFWKLQMISTRLIIWSRSSLLHLKILPFCENIVTSLWEALICYSNHLVDTFAESTNNDADKSDRINFQLFIVPFEKVCQHKLPCSTNCQFIGYRINNL